MTTDGPAPERDPRRRSGDAATTVYVGIVVAVGLCLTATAIVMDGIALDGTFWVMVVLGGLTWWFRSVAVDGDRVRLSFTSILLLAAMGLLGPAGAGILGALMGPLQRGFVPVKACLFNTGMFATMGVVGAAAYGMAASGSPELTDDLIGTSTILRYIAIPVMVAGVVQLFVNLLLLAGVVRLAEGVPMRSQVGRLLRSSGPATLGYGAIAFLMIVLWEPAGLGPASVVLVLPPLVVAQWAYRQYSEEVKGHDRALHVLVAAVEAKAPHLGGHSTRVAELSGRMAEHLGLRPQAVADTRVAALLHDLGQTTLPTGLVRGVGLDAGTLLDTYPARGVEVLRGISFLSGSLDAIERHREVLHHPTETTTADPALVVGAADEFDMLTEVGTPDGGLLDVDEAVARLRTHHGVREDVVEALEHVLDRRAAMPAS